MSDPHESNGNGKFLASIRANWVLIVAFLTAYGWLLKIDISQDEILRDKGEREAMGRSMAELQVRIAHINADIVEVKAATRDRYTSHMAREDLAEIRARIRELELMEGRKP